MSFDPAALKALADKAAATEDQTKTVAHEDFDNRPPEGTTVGRLLSYIELGKQPGGEYKGKPKPDADKVRIEFELLGPKNIITFERDGVEHKIGQIVHVTLKKSLSDKAKFKKLFSKMQYGRPDKTHMAQMLGDAFILEIVHNTVGEGDNARTYVNIEKGGEYTIRAPFVEDPLTQTKTAVQVPDATQPYRLFLWDNPVQEMWDSLFIDGTREVKKQDGTTEQVSKNWLQEAILSAKNFQGSPLHQLLVGVSAEDLEAAEAVAAEAQTDLEDAIKQSDAPADPTPAEVAQATAEAVAESENPAPATSNPDADALAALGLLPS